MFTAQFPRFVPGCALVAGVFAAGASAKADVLFSSDFENMDYGTIHGQHNWTVDGDRSHGQVVYLGSTSALAVYAVLGWGAEVKTNYDAAATRQYVVISLDFEITGEGGTFWFMDNNADPSRGPDSIFFYGDAAASNAHPGIPALPVASSEWHYIAIEVDQTDRRIVGVNYDGEWWTELDGEPTDPSALTFLVFRGYAGQPESDMTPLYVDNLLIEDGDSRISPVNRRPADLNCDNGVTVGDIGGFVLALTNPAAYQSAFPGCDFRAADVNFDGVVTVGDIGRFVQMLIE